MSQCERCKGFPGRLFIETAPNQPPRHFCPVCVICVAGGYLAKAQQRKVQDRKRKARRHTAPEATQ